MLERALRDGVRQRRVPPAAVDGTGLESRTPAGITSMRRASSGDRDQSTTYAKYPKVVFVVDCSSHMILAADFLFRLPTYQNRRPSSGAGIA